MNAHEIIKNIITDGIEQCKVPIWDRLQIPDFKESDPRKNFTKYNSAEDWLNAELQKIPVENLELEKVFYALKPLMSEKEYLSANFSYIYKIYAPDYFEYKNNWESDHKEIDEIENYINVIKNLFDTPLLSKNDFLLLNLPESILKSIDNAYMLDYSLQNKERWYEKYCYLWEKYKTDGDKRFFTNEFKSICIPKYSGKFEVSNILEIRRKEIELKSNYIKSWNQLIKMQETELKDWEFKRENHINSQEIRRKEIDSLKINYFKSNPDSIVKFGNEILNYSSYIFEFEKGIEVDFNSSTKTLIIEYMLPNPEQLPQIKEVKYLSSRKEYKNIMLSKSEIFKLFDDAVYGITLRSIYEIFINDTAKAIDAISFNGWIKSRNKATGKKENSCIVSIQVKRNDFMDIELSSVEPKSCFKFFKGVGSSKLYGITAIQPILQIQKNDKRFVNTQDIEFDNSTNLALMDWEDFEHLIRELFEKEFSSNGGEVKVTQASRDGGVDAIAFDPDPIRGGKIVIQAKRYTNTVGVSAVRDLFGTVMNEGANKGILVTTSDYGPDSYEFAKGKPLTLLNGANLLYLLEKHGTRAKIDIKEARRIMEENKF